jgi:hypothetical protein
MDKPHDNSLNTARYHRAFGNMWPKFAPVPVPGALSGLMLNALERTAVEAVVVKAKPKTTKEKK